MSRQPWCLPARFVTCTCEVTRGAVLQPELPLPTAVGFQEGLRGVLGHCQPFTRVLGSGMCIIISATVVGPWVWETCPVGRALISPDT